MHPKDQCKSWNDKYCNFIADTGVTKIGFTDNTMNALNNSTN